MDDRSKYDINSKLRSLSRKFPRLTFQEVQIFAGNGATHFEISPYLLGKSVGPPICIAKRESTEADWVETEDNYLESIDLYALKEIYKAEIAIAGIQGERDIAHQHFLEAKETYDKLSLTLAKKQSRYEVMYRDVKRRVLASVPTPEQLSNDDA